MKPAPIQKGFVQGTHRAVTPAETVESVLRHRKVMGITRVANVTGLDVVGLPVVMVCRPNSRSLAVSQGKGLTLDHARASGVMESIELYHAERIVRPVVLATHNELRYSAAVADPHKLPRLSVSHYHDNFRLLWIEGTNLLTGQPTLVPYEMVHADYTLPLPTGSGSFVMSSNGLASGNHLLEAISHAICEVVERDAVSLWNAAGRQAQRRMRLDLDTVDDPGCLEVLRRYDEAGIAVAVWHATSDVGLPCFICAICDESNDVFRQLYVTHGMGCHPTRAVALMRALTEAAQSRLTFIAGSRDDVDRERFEAARNPDYVEDFRARIADDEFPRVSFKDAPDFQNDTFNEDVGLELKHLAAVGITQVVVVDLTRPEFKVPVCRAVIPGLEAFHEVPGYVPGPRARAVRAAENA